jgi:hypothetical protein
MDTDTAEALANDLVDSIVAAMLAEAEQEPVLN